MTNNKDYIPIQMIPKALEDARSVCSKRVAKIIAPLNSAKKIDNAVDKYASKYFEIDEEFEGDTLEEYKDYMRESLYKYVIISMDINNKQFEHMSFHEQNTYMLHIKKKYKNMFLQFIYDSV